jgi:hypothetical protein
MAFFELFASPVIGNFGVPEHLCEGYGGLTGECSEVGGTGLIGLVSNIVRLVIVLGGLWTFINLLMAGFTYVTAGENAESLVNAHKKIYMSLIGMAVMVGSFALTAVISYLFYGDAGTILNPVIYGPGS